LLNLHDDSFMPTLSLETVQIHHHDDVLRLTLDRPDQRNALSPQLDADLRAALGEVTESDAIRCVVLHGAGGSFCAGADLNVLREEPTPEEMYKHLTERYLPLIRSITDLPLPVVAAIEGTAAGAGMALALACDLRVMAEDAQIVPAFSSIGFVPDSGASYFLARQVGYSRAFEILAESRPLAASRCEELGLTNRVAPAGESLDAALTWAAELAERPTLALGLTKQALHHAADHDLEEVVRFEAQLQKETIQSDDHAEGLAAFLEKRSPSFTGQ
jgi:2-(1,2-epoxy-1,2-dihydrophenyl)acetyl-CoA isomerase